MWALLAYFYTVNMGWQFQDISHNLNVVLEEDCRKKLKSRDILCLVWHIMPPSCLVSVRSEMAITSQKILECLKYCFNTHFLRIGIPPLLSPWQKNNFPSRWDKVCILWHMHSGGWLNTRINMRCRNEILTLFCVDNAFIQCEVKAVLSS